MDGYRTFLGLGHHLGLLLQTADDTVDGIEKVLLLYHRTVMTSRNQGCLIADIGDVGTRETWGLAGEEVDIYTVVNLHRLQMYLKSLLTLVEVR